MLLSKALSVSRKHAILSGSFRCGSCARYSTQLTPNDDHYYLNKSIVPTDRFQSALPRLPVPDLDKTCDRYLASQRAVLDEKNFASTQKIVDEFKENKGKDLHDKLKRFAKENDNTSYITGFWFDMYFKDRRPVVLNHNPFMSFKSTKDPKHMDQLVRATNFVVSSLKYCKTYRKNIMDPEIFHINPKKSDTQNYRKLVKIIPPKLSYLVSALYYKAYPLDMSQFPNLFNSTRVPCKDKDVLVSDETAKHLLVIRNGHLYTFDCYDHSGHLISAGIIMRNLKHIMEDTREAPKHPLGYLTTMGRNDWAEARVRLVEKGNEDKLKIIDTALFCLCLDSQQPTDLVKQSHNFLHGDAANRWFDKSFSLIVTPNGDSAVNFEHSWGDGVAVMSYFNAVYADGNSNPAVSSDDEISSAPADVTRIELDLSGINMGDIEKARQDFNRNTGKLLLNFIEYPELNRESFRMANLGPDSMLQLALQLAYKRCYGNIPATYESCSTSAFKHGRTETIRPATTATNAAVDLILKDAPKEEVQAALAACSKIHNQLTKEAATGQGWDRHLFALKKLAEEEGLDVSLYQDDAYKNINTITLSTSTLSSPAVMAGGFAPVVPHGLGVGYGVHADKLGTVVSGYQPEKNPDDFIAAVKASFDDLKRYMEK